MLQSQFTPTLLPQTQLKYNFSDTMYAFRFMPSLFSYCFSITTSVSLYLDAEGAHLITIVEIKVITFESILYIQKSKLVRFYCLQLHQCTKELLFLSVRGQRCYYNRLVLSRKKPENKKTHIKIESSPFENLSEK